MKPTTYFLVLFLCPFFVFSQSLDYEKSYKKAVWLYKSGDYLPALTELAPLTNASHANTLTPFAHYYYAQSLSRKSADVDATQKSLSELGKE
jgi:TolA-binding protein